VKGSCEGAWSVALRWKCERSSVQVSAVSLDKNSAVCPGLEAALGCSSLARPSTFQLHGSPHCPLLVKLGAYPLSGSRFIQSWFEHVKVSIGHILQGSAPLVFSDWL
jgi:hypothetical protein